MGKFIAGIALLASGAWSQSFDVASIRKVEDKGRRGPFESIQVSPGSLTMRGVRYRTAIAWAYGVRDFQVALDRALARLWARFSQRIKTALAEAEAKKDAGLHSKLMKEYLDVQRKMKEFNSFYDEA